MKKFLAALIFLGMFCGAASADFVYSTTDNGIGIINISGPESMTIGSAKYSGKVPNNSIVESYWENNTSNGKGNSKIILIKTVSQDSTSDDTAVRFEGTNISSPIDDANNPITLQGTRGAKILASTQSGGSVYIASGACVRKYSTKNFTLEKTFEIKSDDITPNPEIKGLLVTSSRVYILVSRNNASNDIMYNLDGQITTNVKNVGSWEVMSGSKTVQFISYSRMAVGHEKGVNIESTKVASTDCPVVSLCSDGGDGLYYATQSDDLSSIYHYSASTNESTELIKNVTGSHVRVYHTDYNTLTAIIGGEMKIYNMENDKLVKTFTASQLGGTPYCVASAAAGGDSGSSGSSGCNLVRSNGLEIRSFLIPLLFVLGLFLRRIKNS